MTREELEKIGYSIFAHFEVAIGEGLPDELLRDLAAIALWQRIAPEHSEPANPVTGTPNRDVTIANRVWSAADALVAERRRRREGK